VKSDIEIARASTMKPIVEIASKIGIPQESVLNYGNYKVYLFSVLHYLHEHIC